MWDKTFWLSFALIALEIFTMLSTAAFLAMPTELSLFDAAFDIEVDDDP